MKNMVLAVFGPGYSGLSRQSGGSLFVDRKKELQLLCKL
jgi:hypothetical protein